MKDPCRGCFGAANNDCQICPRNKNGNLEEGETGEVLKNTANNEKRNGKNKVPVIK